MNVDLFDFDLPDSLIAQEPAPRRDGARLMVLDRDGGETAHRRFSDLASELSPGDLVVLNDTRVLPARLHGRKPTGGAVEMLLVEPANGASTSGEWRVMLDRSRSIVPGMLLEFPHGLTAEPIEREGDLWRVRLSEAEETLGKILDAHGEMPLPPYIRRGEADPRAALDRERYQTVYASVPGAVAAPTAGLHFTPDTLRALGARGIESAFVTLHVGPGTFLPLRVERVEDHAMHDERFVVPAAAAEAVVRARRRGGRIVAVGTTVARTLETRANGLGGVTAGAGRSSLFIYPGYRFGVVDALVTNFHLPRSTLFMLVCAFAGTERVQAAYHEAVREKYRFYSYGDAMLVRAS